jgi:hypothetical protein
LARAKRPKYGSEEWRLNEKVEEHRIRMSQQQKQRDEEEEEKLLNKRCVGEVDWDDATRMANNEHYDKWGNCMECKSTKYHDHGRDIDSIELVRPPDQGCDCDTKEEHRLRAICFDQHYQLSAMRERISNQRGQLTRLEQKNRSWRDHEIQNLIEARRKREAEKESAEYEHEQYENGTKVRVLQLKKRQEDYAPRNNNGPEGSGELPLQPAAHATLMD